MEKAGFIGLDPLILLAIGMLVVVGSVLLFRLHAFLALFLGALIVAALTPVSNIERYAQSIQMTTEQETELKNQTVGDRLARGFGNTCTKIGLLIAFASIIGKALLDSGAAESIVRRSIRWLGDKRAPLGFLSSGFFLGIPVFFDTVFYLLIPLGKMMGTKNERNYLLYILTIIAGTAMAHSLVPPTPGPLFVAGQLQVDFGTMIVFGIIVGIFTSGAGYIYAVWANRRWQIPLRETTDISLEDLKTLSEKKDSELPSFWLSILPILIPVLLIAGKTILNLADDSHNNILFISFINELGNSTIALAIGAAMAILILFYEKHLSGKELAGSIQKSLSSAGLIILITSSGGAFGAILQQTAIGPRIQELAGVSQIAILPFAFFVTAMIRTAQGSATVAMITAAGMLAGFADPEILGCHPVYLALMIGCGSKLFPWMNDSGFWIISRMTGMTEAETLKTASMTLAVMSVVGLVVVVVMASIFPMV